MASIEKVVHNDQILYFFYGKGSLKITTDSLLLSEFIRLHNEQLLLDFGTGIGVIPLLLSTKSKISMIGIEINSEMASLAQKSVQYNHLEDQIVILNTRIQDSCQFIKNNSVDIVVTNPPYFKVHDMSKFNHSEEQAISRHEIMITFEELAKEASRVLKDKGKFVFVHRIERMVELFDTLRQYHLEPKRMAIVYDQIDSNPTLFLLEAVKNGKAALKIEKPMIIKE